MDRRTVLTGATATLSAFVLSASEAVPLGESIDSHAHLFKRGLKLADVRRYAPDYDATVDQNLAQMDASGISKGVIIQPRFLGVDNSFMLECIAAARHRLRGVAVVEPSTPMDELLRLNDAGVVGVRLNLIGRPLPELQTPIWQSHLEMLARLEWQVEVQCKAAEHAILAPQILTAGVNLVIDHFGLPDPSLGVGDPAFRKLLSLGETGRLWVKLSAAYRLGPNGDAIARQAYPLLKQALGLHRLLWGSDWPHTQNESTQSFAANLSFLDKIAEDPADRAQILSSGKSLFRF